MGAIQRLYEYIDTQRLSVADFERQNQLSNGYLGKMRKRNAGIGEEVLVRIIENCPDLSPLWLLLGEGEMLRSAQPSSKPTDTHPSTDNTEIEQLRQEVQRLKDEKIKLLEKIISLQDTH